MDIRNEFNVKINPSQLKWLKEFKERKTSNKILDIAMTRGGYISVDFERKFSKKFPYGREIRGVRAGWISSYVGRDYDFEDKEISNGVVEHEDGQTGLI